MKEVNGLREPVPTSVSPGVDLAEFEDRQNFLTMSFET